MNTLQKLLLATGNPGKLRELRARMAQTPIEILGLADLTPRPDEVPETGDTFAANAVLKAVGYGQIAQMPTLADDSGLCVHALDNAPGVYSARFAGPQATDALNNQLLLEKLAQTPDDQRTAHFHCALALYIPPGPLAADLAHKAPDHITVTALDGLTPPTNPAQNGAVFITHGQTHGRILHAPQGDGGFGYDPLFLSDDLGISFAQAHDTKKSVSHRARALREIVDFIS